jgi:hypothetical protein
MGNCDFLSDNCLLQQFNSSLKIQEAGQSASQNASKVLIYACGFSKVLRGGQQLYLPHQDQDSTPEPSTSKSIIQNVASTYPPDSSTMPP